MRGKNGSRVSFTDAASETATDGNLHDIGRGGMFVATASKLAAGKRIEFEVHLSGGTIAGMGRVVWTRDEARDDLPAGIGIKFIDVDNEALLAIDRIVGLKQNVRERTMLGIAAPTLPTKVEAKVEAPKPKLRERTMLGIAPAAPREEELSWPEVPPEPPPEPAPPAESIAKAAPPAEAPAHEPEKVEPVHVEPEKPAESGSDSESDSGSDSVSRSVSVPEREPERAPAPAKVRVAEAKEPIAPRELPKREERKRGWMIAVLVLVVAGVTAFLLRDWIGSLVSPTGPTPSAVPSASGSPSASAVETSSVRPVVSAAPPEIETAQPEAEEVGDASAVTQQGLDAAVRERDGGNHDGGHHHHDAGPHTHPHPHPSSGTDNPY